MSRFARSGPSIDEGLDIATIRLEARGKQNIKRRADRKGGIFFRLGWQELPDTTIGMESNTGVCESFDGHGHTSIVRAEFDRRI